MWQEQTPATAKRSAMVGVCSNHHRNAMLDVLVVAGANSCHGKKKRLSFFQDRRIKTKRKTNYIFKEEILRLQSFL